MNGEVSTFPIAESASEVRVQKCLQSPVVIRCIGSKLPLNSFVIQFAVSVCSDGRASLIQSGLISCQ